MFQSPRSGKFESNNIFQADRNFYISFQSPRSGKFESNAKAGHYAQCHFWDSVFQSPRSGKFESNAKHRALWARDVIKVSIP